ncbi:hypothetical protein Y032_0120g914 [Ancylostoma ceylanicum]|uniref:Uncharacterized protein n=1 Tax=Ancylostoma ceylanicum TaxID=53326 RepID=A0A016TAQ8_9BILA|nr:hypothetical protein Y032_0120g914 [Ancylostoma ceylanicum]
MYNLKRAKYIALKFTYTTVNGGSLSKRTKKNFCTLAVTTAATTIFFLAIWLRSLGTVKKNKMLFSLTSRLLTQKNDAGSMNCARALSLNSNHVVESEALLLISSIPPDFMIPLPKTYSRSQSSLHHTTTPECWAEPQNVCIGAAAQLSRRAMLCDARMIERSCGT